MSKKAEEVEWTVVEGSIYSVHSYKTKTDSGATIMVPLSIAFNVGESTAQHIVKLHNAHLAELVIRMAGPR